MSRQLNIPASRANAASSGCYHCGTASPGAKYADGEKVFCCAGCLAVYQLLTENGLTDFYRLGEAAGIKTQVAPRLAEYAFLDAAAVRQRLVNFSDERITRVTFRLPAMHCLACVWLLENLFRLKPGVGRSEVNFPRKEVLITFEQAEVTLSEVATLLASLGYPPELKFSDLDHQPHTTVSRQLWMQTALAGFAFGNTMLFSISSYLGLDAASGNHFRPLFGWLSLALAVPVLVYSARDYWRGAWAGLKQKRLNIEVPIAAGIVALFGQSTWQVVVGRGEGYFDSFCGLMFFLLCGKVFQQKTHDRLVFDRDYKSFFPLSVSRLQDGIEERVALSQLKVAERLILRNGELIPADARLIAGTGCIDYSFVTGESRPVPRSKGDYLYSGGRQTGGAIEIETVKDVSQSHLSSLWNQETFRKDKGKTFDTLTNRYSERFTRLVLVVAIGAALFWWFRDPQVSLRAFTAVLIVACPCALALAAPFALGTAQRLLARRGVFLKNTQVLETLARVDLVVFDKTGTLTSLAVSTPVFEGLPLTADETRRLAAVARQSNHPYSVQIGNTFADAGALPPVLDYAETPGGGIAGMAEGQPVWLGSAAWLAARGVNVPVQDSRGRGSEVHLALNRQYRGCFSLQNELRPEITGLAQRLASEFELALISGDNDHDRARMRELFGAAAPLLFNQSPHDKLNFIRECQSRKKRVMMVGDGLNDAGALQQSDAGVAVVEKINAFSPASDIIMTAAAVPQLDRVLRFAQTATRIVRVSFLVSSLYNVVGLSIAAQGLLSPVVCAILMPLSSVTVVAFACGTTAWLERRIMNQSSVPQRCATPPSNRPGLQPENWTTPVGQGGVA